MLLAGGVGPPPVLLTVTYTPIINFIKQDLSYSCNRIYPDHPADLFSDVEIIIRAINNFKWMWRDEKEKLIWYLSPTW
jgi:hypothetical protein